MFSILLAAVVVTNPIVERGEPVRLSPQVEFAEGEQLRSYAFFSYVHDVPAAFVKMNAGKVKENGRDPYWRSIPIAPSNGRNELKLMWKAIYDDVVNGVPYPVKLEEGLEVVRITEWARRASGFVPHPL